LVDLRISERELVDFEELGNQSLSASAPVMTYYSTSGVSLGRILILICEGLPGSRERYLFLEVLIR
jgi:hypothetical protein